MKLDELIDATLARYKSDESGAELLFAKCSFHEESQTKWTTIAIGGTFMNGEIESHNEIWNYGNIVTHKKLKHPLNGLNKIDRNKLIGVKQAFEKIPDNLTPTQLNIDLSWTPKANTSEPVYTFKDRSQTYQLGAYSGKLITEEVRLVHV
jgi:hypothetical protein